MGNDNNGECSVKREHGNCGVSTGICDKLTFGGGELDAFGYWEFPCFECAEMFAGKHFEFVVWPRKIKDKKLSNVVDNQARCVKLIDVSSKQDNNQDG